MWQRYSPLRQSQCSVHARAPSAARATGATGQPAKCQRRRHNQRHTTRHRSRLPTTSTTTATVTTGAKRRPRLLRPASGLHQIAEVLLAITVVGGLLEWAPQAPLARAAFGGSDGGYGGHYRQPHSIAGSAFGYNGLQVEHSPEEFGEADGLLRSHNFKISPKPCSVGRIEGTCMFVWECIKSEGRHVGMCVDSFMFGSCCAHNYTDNIVQTNSFSYTRPTKPIGISSINHRPQLPHKPSINGMTTIERPHGAGTLVIRPSGPHHQGALPKPPPPQPQPVKPPYGSTATLSTTSTASSASSAASDELSLLWTSNHVLDDLQSAASIATAATSTDLWNLSPPPPKPPPLTQTQTQHHWHLTTEPNFITKPRPPSWEKPTPLRPKPPKPSKKPPPSTPTWSPSQQQQQQPQTPPTRPPTSAVSAPTMASTSSTARPDSRPTQTLPQSARPSTAAPTTRPYSRPTSSSSSSSSSSTSSSSTTSTDLSSTKPSTLTPLATTTQQQSSTLPPTTKTTPRPTTSQRPTSTTTTTTTTTTQASLNSAAVESNEIAETASSGATIKTISAARSECGVPVLTRPETRIVGGKSAAFGRWPWQVSVRRTSFFGFSSTHRCGGALINENWIATAGHCVDDLLISQIRIRVGEYDFSHVQEQLPYIERAVASKVVHPKYNFFTYEYDLALVKLEQPLEFAPHVSPICLPQTDSLLIGMNATVTGWGRLSEGGTLPSVLQEVSVPIVSNDNCKSMFLRAGRQEFIPDIFLCAGYETGGQDSCQGDSGGPLQVKAEDGRFFLAGIISWGIGCAEANLPGVCTRISKFVPWIMENVT